MHWFSLMQETISMAVCLSYPVMFPFSFLFLKRFWGL